MKGEAEEAIGTSFVEDAAGHVAEERFRFVGASFFNEPELAGLVHGDEEIGRSGDVMKIHQPKTNVSRFLNEGVREAQGLIKKGPKLDGMAEFWNVSRHSMFAR